MTNRSGTSRDNEKAGTSSANRVRESSRSIASILTRSGMVDRLVLGAVEAVGRLSNGERPSM